MVLHLLWIVPLVLTIAFLSSPRFRGDIAQRRTRRILKHGLEKNRYTILDDVALPSGGGSVDIDHVVVSRFGVFVIKSLYAEGVISGGEFQDRWKQDRWGRSRRIENPLHEVTVQAETLGRQLDMVSSKIHPIVALTGHGRVKDSKPERLVPAEQLIRYMRRKGTHVLEPEQADEVLRVLADKRLGPVSRMRVSKWSVLNLLLVLILISGVWLVFGERISGLQETWSERQEQRKSPENFHSDGSRKTEQEIWEDSLICAHSSDTGRCACYEPDGTKVDLEPSKCQSLAERGSVLKQ